MRVNSSFLKEKFNGKFRWASFLCVHLASYGIFLFQFTILFHS
jgi:hypothetical protein